MILGTEKNNSNKQYSSASIRFINLLECGKLKNYHVRLCSLSERDGLISDYSKGQEQRDLELYKSFMNSSSYDDIRDAEAEMVFESERVSSYIRKIGAFHEDI